MICSWCRISKLSLRMTPIKTLLNNSLKTRCGLLILLVIQFTGCEKNTFNELLDEYGSQCVYKKEIDACGNIKKRMEAYKPTETEIGMLNNLCESSSGWICSLSSYYHFKAGRNLEAVKFSKKSCLLKYDKGCRLGLSVANEIEDKLYFANSGCALGETYLCSKEIEILISQKKWKDAEMKADIRCRSDSNIDCYNLACVQAIQNKLDSALFALEKSIKLGFSDYKLIDTDPDLINLRKSKKGKAIFAKIKAKI